MTEVATTRNLLRGETARLTCYRPSGGGLCAGEAFFLENVGPLSAALRPHILSPPHPAKSCKMLLKQKEVGRTDCNHDYVMTIKGRSKNQARQSLRTQIGSAHAKFEGRRSKCASDLGFLIVAAHRLLGTPAPAQISIFGIFGWRDLFG